MPARPAAVVVVVLSPGVRLDRLDAAGLRALDAALRAGDPVQLVGRPACRWPLDELVPLCHGVEDPDLHALLPPAGRGGGGVPGVTVVIPTHRQRPIGLAALLGQDVPVEVVVLVNGEAAAAAMAGPPPGVAVHRVPWEGHGRTRQVGAELARHPYVLFTVDDAIPLGAGCLRAMVETLEAGAFDAVTARQVPWPTADAVTRARLRAWTPPPGGPAPEATLDNVCALYRREALLADPFDAVPIAEDWRWGRRHRVGYAPLAPVLHSHPRRLRAAFARTRDIHRERHLAGEPPAVPDLPSLLRALPSTVGWDARGALGELLGQYVAARRR